jgi:hypothetical protein
MDDYPVTYEIDYPDRQLNRLTTFFRLFTVIPIFIVLASIEGANTTWGSSATERHVVFGGVSVLVIPPLLMILFRQKYPRWWFDWNLELLRFTNRVGAYFVLLSDTYPSTDEEQYVHLEIRYPDAQQDLNRWLPLVKWFLAIPHYIVLIALYVCVFVLTVVAWFAILFTGRYPRGLFDFVVGVGRWHNRVAAYAFILTTDRYPPFQLGPSPSHTP